MPAKELVAVGLSGFPLPKIPIYAISSTVSVAHADVILINPQFVWKDGWEAYQGKRCLSDHASAIFKEDVAHWRRECATALQTGKTVVILASAVETIYCATGQTEYSGTGRNALTKRMVAPATTFDFLPVAVGQIVLARGTAMRTHLQASAASSYWRAMADRSCHEVYLEDSKLAPLIVAAAGDRLVGGYLRTKEGGLLIWLPMVYPPKEDKPANSKEEGRAGNPPVKKRTTAKTTGWGHRFVSAVLDLDQSLRSEAKATPPPQWAQSSEYSSVRDKELAEKSREVGAEIAKLNEIAAGIGRDREGEAALRGLLYETGKPLEHAIRLGLEILGFKATPFRGGDSEFDVIFESDEGRFLGEAEGKDSKAINIDKLSQLERNIQEDFARESVTEHAHGVLFGNAARLEPPDKRSEAFTAKCLSGAKRSGIALVRTPDLFLAVLHVKNTGDQQFAAACRKEIQAAKGRIVEFPKPPAPAGMAPA